MKESFTNAEKKGDIVTHVARPVPRSVRIRDTNDPRQMLVHVERNPSHDTQIVVSRQVVVNRLSEFRATESAAPVIKSKSKQRKQLEGETEREFTDLTYLL